MNLKRFLVSLLSIMMLMSLIGAQNLTAVGEEPTDTIEPVIEGSNFNSFKIPRPGKNAVNVPLNTSFYIKLAIPSDNSDRINIMRISVQLQEEGSEPQYIINEKRKFAPGYSGSITQDGNGAIIFIDQEGKLKPNTKYYIIINAKSSKGNGISEEKGKWSFTTGNEETVEINYSLDVKSKPDVTWHGQFFGGLLKPDFATTEKYGTQRFDFIYSDEVRKEYPDAWNLFRLHRVTGFDYYSQAKLLPSYEANVVREMETRHVVSIDETDEGVLLKVEDFFGHEQYGIESNRPVSVDYKPGYEVMISDGTNSVRTTVISANDKDMTVLVEKFTPPKGGWNMDYYKELPTESDPKSPGLFAQGGVHLTRFNPHGTPVYFWDRLDHEFDIYHKRYGNRIALGFVEGPGDVSLDGKVSITAKDLVEMHQVAYDITYHFIDRYGEATLDWVWSVFNEPDLTGTYWRTGDWIELQRFYDYTSDGILRAFEDKGYDSNLVVIGGLELGGIFGTNLRLEDFLAHCSPTADKSRPQTLEKNAAYADPRLDGKRSKRVEELCSANNGEGAPLDFVSIHTYNNAEWAAKKIIHTKQVALDIDPEYYEDLWINNFESMPTWSGFNDPGASEWTLGNGYLPTWVSNYVDRLLQKASVDPRFSYGESILTVWGFPSKNFQYLNDVVTELHVGTRVVERTEIVPKPVFHFVNLLSTMSDDYWVFAPEQHGGHMVSGFASPTEEDIRLLLYAHDQNDTQCRSDKEFTINVDLKGLEFDEVMVTEYQFDKKNNTYYPFAAENKARTLFTEEEAKEVLNLSKLRATNRTTYQVGEDGSLSISVPVAANGANFVIIGEPYEYEETPLPTPTETPDETPAETPVDSQTPADTQTPDETQTPAPGEPTEDPSGEDKPRTGDSGIAYFAVIMLISVLIIVRYRKLVRL